MRRIGQAIVGAAVIAGALIFGLIVHLVSINLSGNFHTVVPGQVYRSAQVVPGQLARLVGKTGLRSVLNLRGAHPDEPWYRAERAEAADLGLEMRDFRMSDREQLTPDRAAELLALMRDLPKPLLIHCRAGADRTGLAAALYLAAVQQMPADEAESQLSLAFGHFSVPVLSAAWPMDESFQVFKPWLAYTDI